MASGSRKSALASVKAPALIIHGDATTREFDLLVQRGLALFLKLYRLLKEIQELGDQRT